MIAIEIEVHKLYLIPDVLIFNLQNYYVLHYFNKHIWNCRSQALSKSS